MTDRERAIAILEAAGFERLPTYGGASWAPSLWFDRKRGDIRETVIVEATGKVVYRADAYISDLPALFPPPTLEEENRRLRERLDRLESGLRALVAGLGGGSHA